MKQMINFIKDQKIKEKKNFIRGTSVTKVKIVLNHRQIQNRLKFSIEAIGS